MSLLIVLIVMFLLCSGIMATIDAAVLSVTRPEVEELILNGKHGARALKSVKHELTRAVVVVVILTNTINVLGPVLVSQQARKTIGPAATAMVVAVMTLGTIVFSEIIPKAIGTHYAPGISRIAAGPIRCLQFILFPLVLALEALSALFTKGTRRIGTEAQIRSLTTIGHKAGYIEADEGRLIHRAFVLNDRTAVNIMTPLKDVVSVSASESIEEAARTARQSPFSRFPVLGETSDDIHGIVMIRDLLEAAADGSGSESVESLARPAFLVGADQRSDQLLLAFRNRHTHLAVVRDRRRTVGVVTLEDVLEELVGEIEDEKDVE